VQRLNDVFTLRGKDYKVVDIHRESVLIQGAKTGEKVTVPLLSGEERAAALGRPSAPAPAPEPAAAF
jgi:Lhr-like helicase